MQKYDAVVIGAGNGGLAAACRMAKGGKKTLLVERHNLPGGCASSLRPRCTRSANGAARKIPAAAAKRVRSSGWISRGTWYRTTSA